MNKIYCRKCGCRLKQEDCATSEVSFRIHGSCLTDLLAEQLEEDGQDAKADTPGLLGAFWDHFPE